MKIKFEQWWSTIQPISTKQTITSHLKSLNRIKTQAYDIGNPGHGLGQAKKCGRVTIVNGIPAPPLSLGSPMAIQTMALTYTDLFSIMFNCDVTK